jgi:cell division septation protein DedD
LRSESASRLNKIPALPSAGSGANLAIHGYDDYAEEEEEGEEDGRLLESFYGHPDYFISTTKPSLQPTPEPTEEINAEPFVELTAEPSAARTPEPTEAATAEPSEQPTPKPTEKRTSEPTKAPSARPSPIPTTRPTARPSFEKLTPYPSAPPTTAPTVYAPFGIDMEFVSSELKVRPFHIFLFWLRFSL